MGNRFWRLTFPARNTKLRIMRQTHIVFYLLVLSAFFLESVLCADTIWLLEPPAENSKHSFYQQFSNELALVLVQDELYRRSEESTVFFDLSPEEKVARAGALCGNGERLSVIWIEADPAGVRRLGLVVSTENGKLARWIQFDTPVTSISDLAIITGEILDHGRTFAASSTAEKDGWILVESEKNKIPKFQLSPSMMLDVEKPWDKRNLDNEGASIKRFSLGADYGFSGGLTKNKGPRLWMGGGVHGSFWPLSRFSISLLMDIHGGVIPDSDDVRVRGVRLAPALSVAFFIDIGPFGLQFELAGGPMVTLMRIERTGRPSRSDNWLAGRGQFEVLMVIISTGPVSLHFGPAVALALPTQRYVEVRGTDKTLIFSTSSLAIGINLGVFLKL